MPVSMLEQERNIKLARQEQGMSEAIFKGASGKFYRFYVLRPSAPALPEAALYVFARPGPNLSWRPLFLSRTANLARRLKGHERWEEARLLGATHVLALFEPDRTRRAEFEEDLLDVLRPALNAPFEAEAEHAAPARIASFYPPFQPRKAG